MQDSTNESSQTNMPEWMTPPIFPEGMTSPVFPEPELLEAKIDRPWWRRGAAVAALLFLLNTFTVTGLWLVGLADALPACLVSVVSFVIAFFLAAIDEAKEKEKRNQ